MKKLGNMGAVNVLLIPLIILGVLFATAGSFAIWAYMSRQDYKENADQKVETAVEVAVRETESAKDNEFLEREKFPLKEYQSPAQFGGVVIQYPKTWGAYVDGQSSANPVNGFFHPVYVPGVSQEESYALRVQVVNSGYEREVGRYESHIRNNRVTIKPYVPEKAQDVTGVRIDGEVQTNKTGSMVLVPLRDKTLKIWTESTQFIDDFDNIILPNYTFES